MQPGQAYASVPGGAEGEWSWERVDMGGSIGGGMGIGGGAGFVSAEGAAGLGWGGAEWPLGMVFVAGAVTVLSAYWGTHERLADSTSLPSFLLLRFLIDLMGITQFVGIASRRSRSSSGPQRTQLSRGSRRSSEINPC
jgi:hypothetical protein